MRDDERDALDKQLGSIFQQGIEHLGGDAFRIAVLRRIKRRARLRQFVLLSSITVGTLIALVPAYELTLALSNGLIELLTQWSGVDWPPQNHLLSFAMIMALLSPLLTRLLED